MIYRTDYIKAIAPFIDKPIVKILAGIRRAGKSTIFEMLRQELLRRGVPDGRIISRRYTGMELGKWPSSPSAPVCCSCPSSWR